MLERCFYADRLGTAPQVADVAFVMLILRTVPNLKSSDLEKSRRFYRDTLKYEIVMDLDWIVTFASATHPSAQLSVITRDPSGYHPAVSIEVDDADAAHSELLRQGYEVVYPLRDEPWGVRRFFARDPDGTIVNVVAHLRA
jgi:catechol 2,3-dioxygenase-like lactoylglutathione lyase family enzyme